MKKSYVKPQVYFENCQLSADIAGNCGASYKGNEKVTLRDVMSGCGYKFNDGVVFVSQQQGCTYESQDGTDYGICYHVPSAGDTIFAS